MKSNILFFSDCSFFAGCENMIANMLNSDMLSAEFALSFAYNYSPRYEEGLNARVKSINYNKYPLSLKNPKVYVNPVSVPKVFIIFHKLFFGFYLPMYKYYSIFINTITLYKFLKNKKIDILHINNGGYPAATSCYAAVIAAKIVGIKNVIYVVNNIAQNYKHPFRWLDHPIDFFIKKWVKIFITGSVHAGEKLKNVLKLKEYKHIAIPNGIKKREITLNRAQFIKKYNLPECRLIAAIIANLEIRKGHIFLYEAILKIQKQYDNKSVPFFIIEGNGPEKSNLEKYIKENKLEENILMVDFIPDIYNLINASDFLILPSISNEDFPNVILEGMSMGKAVIATSIAGIPEQIENFKTGIIVPPRNSEELKCATMELVLNPSRLEEFSKAAKARFDSLYTESISLTKYFYLYKSLIK